MSDRRNSIYVIKVNLRYAALRKLGLSSREAYRCAQNLDRFKAKLEELVVDPGSYATLLRRDAPGPPSSADIKARRKRERRRHLRSLGVEPDKATWYSERGRLYEALVEQLQPGAEVVRL